MRQLQRPPLPRAPGCVPRADRDFLQRQSATRLARCGGNIAFHPGMAQCTWAAWSTPYAAIRLPLHRISPRCGSSSTPDPRHVWRLHTIPSDGCIEGHWLWQHRRGAPDSGPDASGVPAASGFTLRRPQGASPFISTVAERALSLPPPSPLASLLLHAYCFIGCPSSCLYNRTRSAPLPVL